MLWRVASQLSKLKAFDASTRRTASVCWDSKLGSLHAQLLHIQIYDLHILEEDPLLLGCLQLW